MAETAFSKQFNREIDPEQYVALLGSNTDIHGATRSDIICPVCKVGGASYVSATTGQKARKAHFRFTSDTGASAHHPLCDFYDDKLSSEISDKLVDFTVDRTELSAAIRQRICAGIQAGVFTQQDMWEMRSWFFELRTSHSIPIQLPDEDVKWLYKISAFWRQNSFNQASYAFHPSHTAMPGFNWKRAIASEYMRIHRDTLEQLFAIQRETSLFFVFPDIAKLVESKKLPKSVIDPQALSEHRSAICQLKAFIRDNDPAFKGFNKKSVKTSLEQKFSAFAALLLFTSGWNAGTAIDKYINLIAVKDVDDMLAGNMIGLDLTKDYQLSASLLRLQLQNITYLRMTTQDVEMTMRHACQEYQKQHAIPTLPPPIYSAEANHRPM